MPYLVGTGLLPDAKMSVAAKCLADEWGGDLLKISCNENPHKFFMSIHQKNGMIQLIGDAGLENPTFGSWLEALGFWKKPTILLTLPLESGEISGSARAYVALCKEFKVPLIGILQLGGNWDPSLRRNDGLPWCGLIPYGNSQKSSNKLNTSTFDYSYLEIGVVTNILKSRLKFIESQ